MQLQIQDQIRLKDIFLVAMQHGKREQDRGGRAHILAVAQCLFNSRGFHQTSMAELATAAQISIGQIYRLFKGKEDIILALVEEHSDKKRTLANSLRARLDSGELTIEQTFEQFMMNILEDNEEGFSFDILSESFRNVPVGETIAAMSADIRTTIRHFACAANPRLSGAALDGAEEVVLACLFGLGHRRISRPQLGNQQTAAIAAQMLIGALVAIG